MTDEQLVILAKLAFPGVQQKAAVALYQFQLRLEKLEAKLVRLTERIEYDRR